MPRVVLSHSDSPSSVIRAMLSLNSPSRSVKLRNRPSRSSLRPPSKVPIHSVPSPSSYSVRIWSLESPSALVYSRCSAPRIRHRPLPKVPAHTAPSRASHSVDTPITSTGPPGITVSTAWPCMRISPPGVASHTSPAASSIASYTLTRENGSGGVNALNRSPCIRAIPPCTPISRSPLRAWRIENTCSPGKPSRTENCEPPSLENCSRPLSPNPTQIFPARSWKTTVGWSLGSPSLFP